MNITVGDSVKRYEFTVILRNQLMKHPLHRILWGICRDCRQIKAMVNRMMFDSDHIAWNHQMWSKNHSCYINLCYQANVWNIIRWNNHTINPYSVNYTVWYMFYVNKYMYRLKNITVFIQHFIIFAMAFIRINVN